MYCQTVGKFTKHVRTGFPLSGFQIVYSGQCKATVGMNGNGRQWRVGKLSLE